MAEPLAKEAIVGLRGMLAVYIIYYTVYIYTVYSMDSCLHLWVYIFGCIYTHCKCYIYTYILYHIGIYQASFTKVAVREMTSVITITQVKTPLAINQYVRISRGKSRIGV